MVASSDYNVNIIISQKTTGDANVKKAVGSWTELKSALGLAKQAFNTVYQIAQKVYAFIGEGAAVERAEIAIGRLAKSYGTSGDEIVEAIQSASDFTIDRMTAMQVANKAMLMGVAKSPEQFEELARTATVLGRAMGLDATTAIDRFTIAAGRKSVKVADDLGLLIDATAANEKYAKSLNKSVDQLNASEQSQAFLNAMMDAAAPKVAVLGSTTLTTADKMEIAEAAVTDTKSSLSKLASTYWVASGQADGWNTTLGAARDITDWLTKALSRNVIVVEEASQAIIAYNGYIGDGVSTMENYGAAVPQVTAATRLYLAELAEGEQVGGDFINTTNNIAFAIEKAAIDALAKATHEVNVYNAAIKEFSLDAGMRWKSYYDGVDEQAETFESRREKMDADHLEKMADLNKRGQSRAIVINEEAEKKKLDDLVWSLEQAELQLSEYGDKTNQSTINAKQRTIETLKGQITDQQTLLDNYYAGRLRTTGENVNALITEEDRRHAAAVAGLEEEIAKTKDLQRQQLGSLMLQTFETWAGIKDIPADAMIEMRTAIAKEYGLISEEEAQLVNLSVNTWETWAEGTYENTEITATQLAKNIDLVRNLQQVLSELPSQKVIDVILNMQTERVDMVNPMFMGGGAPSTTNNSYVLNQTVNTQATTHNVLRDYETARAQVE